jgi:hypothetical protein
LDANRRKAGRDHRLKRVWIWTILLTAQKRISKVLLVTPQLSIPRTPTSQLAGIGFDDTQVKLIADPDVSENIHEVRATGDFGSFYFEIRGHSLPDNPRSSALAAMSIVSKIEQESQRIIF